MLVSELFCNPNYGRCTERRRISENFPKVIVIGFPKLILDHDVVLVGILRENVGRERPDRNLYSLKLKLKTNRVAEPYEVLIVGEPRGELVFLMLPMIPD